LSFYFPIQFYQAELEFLKLTKPNFARFKQYKEDNKTQDNDETLLCGCNKLVNFVNIINLAAFCLFVYFYLLVCMANKLAQKA